MTDLQHSIGLVLRRERRERRLTMKALAAAAAISVVYLGEIEHGKKYPSPLVIERLAEALGVPVSDLLEGIAAELRAAAAPRLRAVGFRAPAERQGAPHARLETEIEAVIEMAEGQPLVRVPRRAPRGGWEIRDCVA